MRFMSVPVHVVMSLAAAIALWAGCRTNPLQTDRISWRRASLTERCHHRAEWFRRSAGREFAVLVDPPFVLAGNLPAAELEAHRRDTVRAAARALWARFADTRPGQPIVILLFSDETSYRKYAREWFGDRDVPYFGYFRGAERTLVMNIATGTGTLVHELTHALTAADFPRMPDWLNEGLASLFEQCTIDGDDIKGQINWRLPTLQRAIRTDRLSSLAHLLTTPRFRGENESLNYAHARYFCMYLQQQSKLVPLYRRFRDGVTRDPSGARFVRDVFDGQSLATIDVEFREWARTLKYPPLERATHAAKAR